MRLPNQVSDELVEEIYYQDKDSLDAQLEKASAAGNSQGVLIANRLHKGDLDSEQVVELSKIYGLDKRETRVFTEWVRLGVRNNTSVWFYAASHAFEPFAQQSDDKTLATLLFIDTYNRADEVFDTFREDFVDRKHRKVVNEDLDHTPILVLEDGTPATVEDFKRVLFKVVKNCGQYDESEVSLLRWHVENFVDISTQAQRDFEAKRNYSGDEALGLRWLTVGPMTHTIASLYATSPWELSTPEHEKQVDFANRQFLKMVIAWQLVDDYYDLSGDVARQNVNLVAGIMHDEHLMVDGLGEDYQATFEEDYPYVVEGIRSLYSRLTADLNPVARGFLEDRVPAIFLSRPEVLESTEDLE